VLHLQLESKLTPFFVLDFFKGWNWHDDPQSPVELNINRGTHIAPWAATLYGAYALWLKEVRDKEVFLDYKENTYLGSFLERIGLPQLLGYKVSPQKNESQRICPLTRIRDSKEIAPFVNSVMELLQLDEVVWGQSKNCRR